MLVLPLTCGVADVPDEDDILLLEHITQEVISLPTCSCSSMIQATVHDDVVLFFGLLRLLQLFRVLRLLKFSWIIPIIANNQFE